MSKGNPRKAMAALLPMPLKVSGGYVVRPMTLGMWAALERIESPLVTDREPKDALEIIPSLYLLTHDPREVFRGNVIDLAMEWADTVPVKAMDEIQRACYRQMNAAFDVLPDDDLKKARRAGTTAGFPRSSTGQPKRTTGASGKSCGKSRSLRSRSSSGARESTQTVT